MKWQARPQEDKKKLSERKQNIQEEEEMALLMDIPKAGFGNTNDWNSPKTFISDPETCPLLQELT